MTVYKADELPPWIAAARLARERPHELTGILRGVLADGALVTNEVQFIHDWMQRHPEVLTMWPWDVLYGRICAALLDGVIDGEEERELIAFAAEHLGTGNAPSGGEAPSELLCDRPAPPVIIQDQLIVLTGVFISGKRREIEGAIEQAGGRIGGTVTRKTNYLVIGASGSQQWIMTTHGTKIEAAARLKAEGSSVAVVAERHFLSAVGESLARGGA